MSNTALAIDYIDEQTNHHVHLPLSVFKKPSTIEEYIELETVLDRLIDEVRDDGNHPLALAMQIIGDNLEQYDTEHCSVIGKNIDDIEMVQHLIQSNHLHQKDLADIFGGQANVSKFLNGKRKLGKAQIAGLKMRFGLSADFFL